MFKMISTLFWGTPVRGAAVSPQSLPEAQAVLASLLQREQVALCQVEALLGWLTDQGRQAGLGRDTIAVMADELVLRRRTLADLERQILQQRRVVAGLDGGTVPQRTPVQADGWVARLGGCSIVQLGDVRRQRMLAS
jgi:hypothetical protein